MSIRSMLAQKQRAVQRLHAAHTAHLERARGLLDGTPTVEVLVTFGGKSYMVEVAASSTVQQLTGQLLRGARL